MPSTLHEVLIELFRHRPPLAAELLTDPFDIKLPAWDKVSVLSSDFSELVPTEYRADLVTLFSDVADAPVQAVVLEVQLRRDPRKLRSWPAYVAMLYARLGCPTVLMVVCPDRPTADWAAAPIELGAGSVVTPLVLGPDRVPLVTEPGQAVARPELAVLSALAHSTGPEQARVLDALWSALETVDTEHATLYAGVVLSALPAAIRSQLEALMTTATGQYRDYLSPFVNRFVDQGRAEGEALGEARGEARGEAKALLTVLAARGIELPEAATSRIAECADVDQLEEWVRRAATVGSADELFTESNAPEG